MEQTIEIKEDSFNYTALLLRLLDYWYLFVVSVILALACGYFYNKFNSPLYEVSTTIMIENESPSFSSERILEEMGLFSQHRNILNEKIILQSYDVVSETLRQMDYVVTYYLDHGYRLTELYRNNPFIVILDSLSPQIVNIPFEIEFVSDNKFLLKVRGNEFKLYSYLKQSYLEEINNKIDFSGKYAFGSTISNSSFGFKILPNINNDLNSIKAGDKYKFIFNNLNELTLKHKKILKIDLFEKDVDVFVISIQGYNIEKITDFLNRLTTVYIVKKLGKKNAIANNTIRFIDNQLFSITDSLTDAENQLQNFRSSSKMMHVTFQTEELFDHLSELEREKAVLLSQRRYFDYALKTIKEGENLDNMMIPSTLGIADANLNTLISELIELSSRKMTLSSNTSEKSQAIINIELHIESIIKLITNELNSLIDVSEISLRNLEDQISKLEDEVEKLPETQQKLLGYERQFTLNNEIYNFLMEKRAEAQIAKASNTPDSEIIEAARSDVFKKKSMKFSQVLAIAFLLGLFIPGLGISLVIILKDIIIMRQDIEELTDTPIVGSILLSKYESLNAFIEKPNSPYAESLRSFYTNLQYFTKGKEQQVILLSSSMPKEGKTFNSINLASVYASFGKKTCLLSFDLRLAKVHKAFNIQSNQGLSTYLINLSKLEDIIFPSGIDNLDIIPAGPVPPNPVELIASERTEELFHTLKKDYKCVIIDSPPLGVVADALILSKYSDINVIVTRQNYTRKKVLSSVIKELDANGIKNRAILFNGIKQSRFSGYGYSYGYGYYKEEKEFWIKRIIQMIKKWKQKKHITGM